MSCNPLRLLAVINPLADTHQRCVEGDNETNAKHRPPQADIGHCTEHSIGSETEKGWVWKRWRERDEQMERQRKEREGRERGGREGIQGERKGGKESKCVCVCVCV